MITNKQELHEYIEADECVQPQHHNLIVRLICGRMFSLKKHLRKCEYHHNVACSNNFQKLYHKLAYYWHLYRLRRINESYGSEIPINVFGKGLAIWHGQRIIVNPNVRVGDYCSLSSGVVLAETHDKNPVIGNNVELMVDSKVLGGITVADNVRIGANTVVLKSINEPNTTWVGYPARKVSDKGTIETPVPRVGSYKGGFLQLFK
ncbi:LbetaH domain-containing protein [Bifidobacterium cebidarum]|uniref:Serine acetyltransferase n=1 Tax=Bifidobacterium cebidarum TaxID=2650773 RepID=A0A6I1GED0_9BIFI|nr:hypothetical protein [Bifidobacterium cebidarum]KAB7788136.1 serine acetyltransferase [Bifidobacterium cebidarum]